MPSVSAITLAYGSEPWLERSVDALLASTGVDVEVILVDNGCTDGAVDRLAEREGVTVVRPGRNLGFPGGCNAGAERAGGDVLAFVNPDALAAPDALARLAEVAQRPSVGIATASVRLADAPERLNSGGNEIHFLGLSWSGAFQEEAAAHAFERDVAGASGAAMAMSRDSWMLLGGFEERYFLYHEDAELSLRSWQAGRSVVYVPDAVVWHRYEFSRNRQKFYLIERNRLILLFTLFEARTLILLLPALLALELAMISLAVRRGWLGEKLAGWIWLARQWHWLRSRRAVLQAHRSVRDRQLVPLFASRVQPGNFVLPGWLRPLDAVLAQYWAVVQRLI